MKIGYKIKSLRNRQRVTLAELAKRTGLTTSFLSQLERDLTSPSISSLEKIALSLGTKVANFFETAEKKELVFIKKGAAMKFIDQEKHISAETLAGGLWNIKMQPYIFTIGIGAELTRELNYPEGEKFGIVLKGKLELLCAEENFIFEEGDSIYCAHTQQTKKITNVGGAEAKFLWIVFRSG
ncbi:MAG: helix-turn-helix transcriptional regulator [Elusimicrobia bacterium]|nr:helix-turn-helix transcriptional regulator [Elusimicrobiota bacterium]